MRAVLTYDNAEQIRLDHQQDQEISSPYKTQTVQSSLDGDGNIYAVFTQEQWTIMSSVLEKRFEAVNKRRKWDDQRLGTSNRSVKDKTFVLLSPPSTLVKHTGLNPRPIPMELQGIQFLDLVFKKGAIPIPESDIVYKASSTIPCIRALTLYSMYRSWHSANIISLGNKPWIKACILRHQIETYYTSELSPLPRQTVLNGTKHLGFAILPSVRPTTMILQADGTLCKLLYFGHGDIPHTVLVRQTKP